MMAVVAIRAAKMVFLVDLRILKSPVLARTASRAARLLETPIHLIRLSAASAMYARASAERSDLL